MEKFEGRKMENISEVREILLTSPMAGTNGSGIAMTAPN